MAKLPVLRNQIEAIISKKVCFSVSVVLIGIEVCVFRFIASSRTGSPKRAVMPGFSRERSEDYMKTYSINKTRIPTPQ